MAKIILVTGATDGIGLATAEELIDKGNIVLVHGRSATKSKYVVSKFNDKKNGKAIPVWGDLSKMHDVMQIGEQILSMSLQVDVLINNAGVYRNQRVVTVDGFEETMAVNHFAVHLLTNDLINKKIMSKDGRIVTVSSMAHQGISIDLNNLDFNLNFSGFNAYATSKLANILFTQCLAEKLSQSKLTANALHPGVISTKLLHKGFSIKGDSVKNGAKTPVYLAISKKVAQINGKYFVSCVQKPTSRNATNKKTATDLWNISNKRLEQFL